MMNIDWPSRARALSPRVCNFVDGRWTEPGGAVLEKRAPRDGALLVRFGAGDAADADAAVASARRAFDDGRWSQLPQQRRGAVLHNLAALIEAHREELALLECLDVGKPIGDAFHFDVPVAADVIRHSAASANHVYGAVYGADRTSLAYELRRPLGVVVGIVGWNFPIVLAAQKIGPALAMGNSLVLKPSELTSLATARLAELGVEAGIPEGVFNVIHGDAAVGSALALHREVDLVTFTGSTATGKKLLIASGQSNMKRLLLECGGKAPSIVFEDSPDLDAVAGHVAARAFWNQGQVCTASSRLLIQNEIKGEFMRILVDKVAALRPADPLLPETKFAALASRSHRDKVLDYIASGTEEGAHIAYRSDQPPPFADGFYVPPVVFDRVSHQQRIAQEEIFGPVLSVLTFRDEAQAVEIANGTVYGLSAIVWTKDLARAHRLAQGIKAGWITVNATKSPTGGPASGVLTVGGHKQSGLGVEGGIDGLKAYTSQSAVQIFV